MRKREEKMIQVTPQFNDLKVDMNYKTGTRGENNCRIVSHGSELDLLYQKVYDEYFSREDK
jgi:hypothetical protein|tara:strand:- start:56 stop:238 length:183 start_codon:yes stop_codon:yes gene_type:complete